MKPIVFKAREQASKFSWNMTVEKLLVEFSKAIKNYELI